MIEGFNVKDQALGTGDTNAYTFDFKIYDLTDLLIWIQDASGVVVGSYRGDDVTFLSGVTFDSKNGGGTITLIANLPDSYVMTMLMAIDDPDQPSDFPDKTSFNMNAIEGALDFLASCIMRVAYLAQRAVKLHDTDDIDLFDPTLPIGIKNFPGGILAVKDDGSGFRISTDAATSSAAAAASAIAAAASAALAAAAAAAAQTAVFSYGTRLAPLNINAVTGLTNHGNSEEMHFIQGNGAAIVVSANPQISAGVAIGARMYVVGESDANTVQLSNGTGLSLNGNCVLGKEDVLGLIWDGANWVEMFRRSAT